MAVCTWLSSSLERNFPATPAKKRPDMAVDAALNESFSFQLAVRNEIKLAGKPHSDSPVDISVRAKAPKGWNIRIRRVGYVPMPHLNARAQVERRRRVKRHVPDMLI